MRHNNIVPNAHFHKYWQSRVRTWFNQPARALRRRLARQEKAVKVFPRPVEGLLRPVVQSTSAKYSMRPRSGRGFTLQELKVRLSRSIYSLFSISYQYLLGLIHSVVAQEFFPLRDPIFVALLCRYLSFCQPAHSVSYHF